MKTEIKKIDDIKRELLVEIGEERVKAKFEDVLTKVTKEAKVPGFRPGHAPKGTIEKHYGSHIHEQVLKELVPDVYNEAIKQENLDVVELPEITDVKLDRSRLSFKATVEVSPEIEVKNYKGIKVNFKKAGVGADDVKKQIDSIKESRKLEVLDDSVAKSLGYPTVVALEEAISRQLLLQRENQERQRIENEIVETLTKNLSFKLPQSLVNRQLQDLVKQTKVDLAMRGFPRDKIEEQDAEIRKNLEEDAKRQVKVYLVLAEIAKKENIALDDHMPAKVMEFLLKEANWQENS